MVCDSVNYSIIYGPLLVIGRGKLGCSSCNGLFKGAVTLVTLNKDTGMQMLCSEEECWIS